MGHPRRGRVSDVIDVLDGDEACRLADRLNADERLKPIVVVTTPAGRRMPYIDASAIAAELGDLAEVYLLATGEYTWAFSRAMPDGTQVYGGAGRVYPIGHDWISDLRRSPLRFAFDEAQGRRTTDTLIADAMAMAAEAGLLDRQTTRAERRHLSGVVKGFPHAERALVEVDRTLVAVIPELVAPGIPLERALARDMTVEGWLDPVGMRLDLRGSVQPADRALTAYAVGDVVLARVAEVEQSAKLELYPGVTVPIAHDDVTPNELDSLDSLMSPGEVVAARVVALWPPMASPPRGRRRRRTGGSSSDPPPRWSTPGWILQQLLKTRFVRLLPSSRPKRSWRASRCSSSATFSMSWRCPHQTCLPRQRRLRQPRPRRRCSTASGLKGPHSPPPRHRRALVQPSLS